MGNNLELRKTGKNMGITFIRYAAGIIVGLATGILIARVLGPEGKGFYTMALLVPMLIVKLVNMGVDSATVYFVSRKDYPIENVVFNNILIGIVLTLISLIIGFIVINWTCSREFLVPGIPYKILLIGLTIIPALLLLGSTRVIFQGLQDFKVFNFLVIIPQVINLILLIVFVWILNGYVKTAVVVYVFGQLFALVMTLILLIKYLKKGRRRLDKDYLKACIGYGWKAHLSNMLSFLNYRLDYFFLLGFISPAAVGIYSVSVGIAEKLWFFSKSASSVLFPRIAELKDDEASRRELTPLISRGILWIPLLLSIPIFFLAPSVIKLLVGTAYVEAAVLLQILLPGIVLGGMSRILSNDIAGRGKPELNLYVALLLVMINIIANIILIPRIGIVGAAIATTICYTIGTIIKVVIYSVISKVKWYKTMIITREDIKLLMKIVLMARKRVTGK